MAPAPLRAVRKGVARPRPDWRHHDPALHQETQVLTRSRFQLGWAAVAMLVILRVTIGWHFLYQGVWKWNQPAFTSEGYLRQAKGPWANRYRELIPDVDGRQRLSDDGKRMVAELADYRDRAVAHYGLSREQIDAVDRLLEHRQAQVREYLQQNGEAIETYLHELARWQEKQDPNMAQVAFQKKRLWDKQKELEGQARPWLAWLAQTQETFADDVASVLTGPQRARGIPSGPVSKLQWADWLVVGSNIAIGVCLMAGLFTRLAAAGGALFLLSIVLSQPPWPTIYPPDPPSAGASLLVNKEVVEMVALATLAVLPVGRWGGLDFFVARFLRRSKSTA